MVLFVVIFTGCSAKGPAFTEFEKPSEDKSLVYIYRTGIIGGSVTPDIHKKNISTNEDVIIGNVKPSGYIKTEVNEGNYEFWAKTEAKNEANIEVKKGNIYCIEHYISIGFFIGHPQFKIVDIEKCKEEITKTNLSIE